MKMKVKFFIGVLFLSIITMSSMCQNDPNDVSDKRDNIVGTSDSPAKWHCTLNDGNVNEDYEVDFTKDTTDASKIYMDNFANNGSKAYATMTGMNITVPEQQVGNSPVSADGVISSDYNTITWTMKFDGDDYTAEMVPGGITKKQLAR